MNFMSQTLYDFSVNDNANNSVSLEKYRGKTLLIVNTASKCGFTPQYDGLEELQKKYSEKDFSVLAFPCNQFGNQEPGSNEEMKGLLGSKAIKWNFTKFLVNKDGEVIKRYSPNTEPKDIAQDIENLL